MPPSHDTVLIANRGEIARRIQRTCRARGFRTVAIYAEPDRDAAFVREADEAVLVGPAPARESYLALDRIVAAALATGAGLVHPGYGFLSENADFAAACEAAGLRFVGPTPATIAAMGSKVAAKALMAAHGVPVVPGYDGADPSDGAFHAAAAALGYPLLVKASAGGGGRGMRVVRDAAGLAPALAAARREAASAFGDDRLLLERYIDAPRHVEVQILGDAHGALVHLFERECSVQRRHQKILEETPAPGLDDATRESLCAAAVRAGRALGYRSAGTVEFVLAPDGAFYFLEVNTRLQVEHPVTELVTGVDLVSLQLDVALGRPLPFGQGDLVQRGHAIEARLYAEDPAHDFLPQAGVLSVWDLPAREGVRVDSGFERRDSVSMHYDPLLAKVVAWGPERGEANRRLVRALEEAAVLGVRTNREHLLDVLRHPAWQAGALSTHFLADHLPAWSPAPIPAALVRFAAVAVTLAEAEARAAARTILPGLVPGFRNNRWRDPSTAWRGPDAEPLLVHYRALGAGRYAVDVAGEVGTADVLALTDAEVRLAFAGHQRVVRFAASEAGAEAQLLGRVVTLGRVPRFPEGARDDAAGHCRAPMTGRVVAVLAELGARVTAGQPLLLLEAMKMEHAVEAPHDGEVAELLVEPGDLVEADQELVRLSAS